MTILSALTTMLQTVFKSVLLEFVENSVHLWAAIQLSALILTILSLTVWFNVVDSIRQSQMGKLGREALSPKELASFQDSISSIAASQKDAALNNDSLDADAVLQLLSQQADESVAAAESSQGNY